MPRLTATLHNNLKKVKKWEMYPLHWWNEYKKTKPRCIAQIKRLLGKHTKRKGKNLGGKTVKFILTVLPVNY
jgi:hypothetical protein